MYVYSHKRSRIHSSSWLLRCDVELVLSQWDSDLCQGNLLPQCLHLVSFPGDRLLLKTLHVFRTLFIPPYFSKSVAHINSSPS